MKLQVLQSRPQHGAAEWPNALLTIPDIALRLNVSEDVVRAAISADHLKPAAKIGRTPAYWVSDIAVAERSLRMEATRRLLNKIRHADNGA